MSPPDGLLTSENIKHDAQLEPDIIAWNPFASDDSLNAFSTLQPFQPFLLTKTEELNTMNAGEDEPSSGLNGRLRPRKSTVLSPRSKSARRAESRSSQDRLKRTSTPSKASSNNPDDLSNKSDTSTAPHHLCPYCDRKFASKQTVSKHARRIHLSASKQDSYMGCLFCNHIEPLSIDIIRHMVDSHPNQYFACLECHTRFHSTFELAEHKLKVCEKQKLPYRSKLRQKTSPGPKKVSKKTNPDRKDELRNDIKQFPDQRNFNGIVISCELKPSQVHDTADIEDNIPTNLILPSSKNIGNSSVLEKNAVIVLDDIQWNKRIPSNFSFHNTDADQILSRLGVIHRSPRTGENTRRDWLRVIDDSSQKFEKCFETSFYSKVASNVQENLLKFLDGSFNYNPDPDNTIKTRKSKNSVVINTAEGFPILLASEQYSRNVFDGYMPRAIAPKHKWKWDNLENDKNLINPDQIKRDSHVDNCIITLVSSLDIWTQLSMRQKFEEKFHTSPIGKKVEKKNIIGKQLKEILESRELPTSSSQMVKYPSKPAPTGEALEFPAALGLRPAAPRYDVQPAVLSGEWVRPRCYVCCACGAQTRDARALSSHISTQHPNAQVQHYEIVGELLLNADILKHLYVPPSQTCNRTRPLRGFRECTKCNKSITLEDLHQHMLDCAGDTPAVRRKCRYRPFGVRRRRPRFPDNTIRKKIRKDIRNSQAQKGHMRERSRPKNKTEVGDAETIRKMIADLPAKRHRVTVNPMNPMLRPRRQLDKQRNKMMMKRRSTDDPKNRRLRVKEANNSEKSEKSNKSIKSPTATTSSNPNDEDNLPLKPKVKRVIANNTRQSEVLKRKAALTRAKRRVAREKVTQEGLESPDVLSIETQQNNVLSTGNVPERIDVNNGSRGSYNVREHSNRAGSNNRNDQPGCSGQRGNVNNPCPPPAQNAPLKHSIARLTANTETHDKSVQFHHLFLVQQECNSVTQHMPTQRQELFENEAVVTRLDKPPLHYPIEQPDPHVAKDAQKSKINKPRKRLTDCIAMLKNKLVEPAPCASTEHVSVQCGSDEPLDHHPVMTSTPSAICNINMKPAEIFYRSVPTQKYIEAGPSSRCPQKPMIQQYHYNTGQVKFATPHMEKGKTRQKKCTSGPEKASTRQTQVEVVKRKSTRQKCQAQTEIESLKKLIGLPAQIDIIPQNPFALHSVKSTFTRSRRDSYKRIETESIMQPKLNDFILHKQKPSSAKTTNRGSQKKSSGPKPSTESTLQIQKTNRNAPKSQCVEQKSPGSRKSQQNTQSISFASAGNLSQQKPVKPHPESSPRMIIPSDVYSELAYNNTTICISPTRVTTTLEPIMTTALDLSGKCVTGDCPRNVSKQRDSYSVTNYDRYGTLDLSNKNPDCSPAENDNNMNDVIVDLRMKSTEQALPQAELDMRCTPPRNESDTVTDLSMKRPDYEYVPTDLSVRRNLRSEYPVISAEDMNCMVQDLSGRSTITTNTVVDMNYAAQDLSGRFTNTINTVEDVNYTPQDLSGCSANANYRPENVKYAAQDLSGRSTNAMSRVEDTNYSAQDLSGRSTNATNRAEHEIYVGQDLSGRSTNATNRLEHEIYVGQDLSGRPTNATNRAEHEIYVGQDLSGRSTNATNRAEHEIYVGQDLSGRSTNATNRVEHEIYVGQDLSGRSTNCTNRTEHGIYVGQDLSGRSTNCTNRAEHEIYVGQDLSGLSTNTTNRVEHEIYVGQDLSGRSTNATNRAGHETYVGQDLSGRLINVMNKADAVNYAPQDLSGRSTNVIDVAEEVRYEAQDLTRHVSHAVNTTEDCTYGAHDLSRRTPAKPLTDENVYFSRTVEIDENLPTDLSATRVKDSSIAFSSTISPEAVIVQETQEIDSKLTVDLTKINECATDLSTKISKEERAEEQTLPTNSHIKSITNLEISETEIEVNQNNENLIPRTTTTHVIDKSQCMLSKPVYDPTLKIPQYKIRVTTTTTTLGLSDSVSCSSKSNTISTQACSTFACETAKQSTSTQNHTFNYVVPYNASVSSIMKDLPVYTLPNSISTLPISKFENTKPVYTLTNTCISVTKIESTCSTTLTNSLLSIPGTTIANTTSVYTLAGTACGGLMNYGVNPHNTPVMGSVINNSNIMNSAVLSANETTRELENRSMPAKLDRGIHEGNNKPNYILTAEQDSETARKIAMLPKELVEILGTIPAGHRDQLLNVLPQYVSNSAPSCLQSELSLQAPIVESVPLSKEAEVVSLSMCQAAILSLGDRDKITSVHQNVAVSKAISPVTFDKASDSRHHASQLTVSLESNNKHSTTFHAPLTPVSALSKTQAKSADIKQPQELINTIQLKSDSLSLYTRPLSKRSSNDTNNIHKGDLIKVIDLTDDENCQNEIKINQVTDKIVCPVIIQPQDIAGYLVPKSKKQKVNDQTASLRAVRIKTPSERHKSGLTESQTLLKKHSEQMAITIVSDKEDNEANKSSDSVKSLAIQQAEVSSTQHGSKNVVADGTFPVAISPTDLEASAEEANNRKSLQLLTPTMEILINKDDKQLTHTENPSGKTGQVTSSNLANKIIRTVTQIGENIASEDAQCHNEINDNSLNIKDVSVVEEQEIHEVADLHWPDPPMQSSTPKQQTKFNKESEQPSVISANNGKSSSEDDSEDDISLATIVKQKQRDQLINIPDTENILDNSQSKPINQSKENEHKLINTNNLYEDGSLLSEEIPNETNMDIEQCKPNSTNPCNISFEKSIVPGYGNKDDIESSAIRLKNIANENDDSNKYTINKRGEKSNISNIKVVEAIDNKENRNASVSTMVENICEKTSPEKCFKVNAVEKPFRLTTSVEQGSSGVNNYTATPAIMLKQSQDQDLNSEKKQIEHIHISSNLNNTNNEELFLQKGEGKNKKLQISNISMPADDSLSPITEELSNHNLAQNTLQDTKEKDTIDFRVEETNSTDLSNETVISESNNNKKVTGTKKSRIMDNVEKSFVGDFKLCSEIEEKPITPLRRSRRGKSMFVDSGVLNTHDSENDSETLFEDKAPLTKKQLIFSKLLLDEENQSELTNQPSSEIKLNVDVDRLTNKNYHGSSLSSSLTHIENDSLHDKCKPYKRKKSPQERRKWKKKRSLDGNQFKKDTDADYSLAINKDIGLVKPTHTCDNIVSELQETNNIHKNEQYTDNHKSIQVLQEQSESRNEHYTDNVAKSNSEVAVRIPKENNDFGDKCTVISEKSVTEKRKLSIISTCADLATNSKPKKSKMNEKVQTINDSSLNDSENKITSRKIVNPNLTSLIHTTCYNRPIAARRTRSKSVVVKSSVKEFYDPYDIDLDDMIDTTEPFAKIKYTIKKSAVCMDTKISESIGQINIKNIKPKECSVTTETATSTSLEVKDNRDMCEYLNSSVEPMDNMDSDDSSKSDVPLQKYVQEKEKKILEDNKNAMPERDNEDDLDACDVSSDKQIDKDLRKSRRTLAVFNNADGVSSLTESDEQLRSEQFMESFGFFSERKPRKSNLLASKKISETFHIIANESDDIYFGFKDRTAKRSLQNENRKSVDGESMSKAPQPSPTKKSAKRGRKKKSCTKITPCYCGICKKEFRRPDNYLRHQMSLPHISKLSEIEMKVKTVPVHEEPNYLIVYKQHLDRLKILTDKLAKRKKNSKSASKIVLPTMEEILADVNKTVREQQLSQRGLSRDEALFIDCCEMLQEAHKSDHGNTETITTDNNTFRCSQSLLNLDLLGKQIDDEKCDSKSDGDVDSITAKNILESEEVRNLENDLISGLQEAANANNAHNANNMNYQHIIDSAMMEPSDNVTETFSSPNIEKRHYEQMDEGFDNLEEPITNKVKKPEVKDKMYPDVIENIDIFEDKFDKIKRKCRSQAAAAKQIQNVVEPCTSHKTRKKSDKKKRKRASKKGNQNTQVLTKGALKGFDGIKVSIPTSDINMSAIVPSLERSTKKKKKSNSKKKRDKKDSESSTKYESDYRGKDSSTPQKKVDVYEFMDNDDAELFEFRPSTLMERFKSISNKVTPSTSKVKPAAEEFENSSESASDGDDFVYMSDDYVCSDDETENSFLSCELGNGKVSSEVKKNLSAMKRKDAVEKNAVMGKIFKHNALRAEKKSTKSKDSTKPKANLDQLFDSLLEDEPSSSMLNNDMTPPRHDEFSTPIKRVSLSSETYLNTSPNKDDFSSPSKFDSTSPKEHEFVSPKKYDTTSKKHRELTNYSPSTSKSYHNSAKTEYGPSTSKKCDKMSRKEHKSASPKKNESGSSDKLETAKSKSCYVSPKYGDSSPTKSDDVPLKSYESKEKSKDRSSLRKLDEGIGSSHDYSAELIDEVSYDDMGVARQRARRKCTVGKQNVLAETWSSESEPDGAPPRPASAESVMLSTGRKKKGKKKEGLQSGGRRANKQVTFKKLDSECRVTSCNRITSSGSSGRSRVSGDSRDELDVAGPSGSGAGRRSSSIPGTSAQAATFLLPGPKVRPRVTPYYWSSEGDDEQEHLQQHGWIVGDSHKKLVTMLAHAKGRKRNGDDKRHLVE